MRVLLIEDNSDHRELMRIALTEYDAAWQVEGVESGNEALRHLAEREAYDVVFLDYSLPGRDGLEVLEEIRRDEAPPPVVVVTGRGDEQVAVKAMKCGAYDYVVKGEGYLQRLPVVAQRAVEANQLSVERKRAEKALRESEERLRTVVEASLDAIIAVNVEGRLVLFNGAAQELFQYSEEEALNQPADILLREEIGKIHQERLEKFLKRGVGRCGHIGRRMEKPFCRKDGSLFEAEVSMSAGRLDGLRLVVLAIHDITERKQGEEALRESEQSYRLLATYHKRLNDISIAFTEASGTEDLFNRIAESFRLLTDAIAATFSVYNQETRALKVVSLSIDPISSGKVGSIFGPELFEMRMPVSADDMEHMLSYGIRRPKDLCELSFGVMPQDISDAVMDAVGCRQIVALAIRYAEELVGTCVAYLPGDQPVVPDDALKTYIYLSGMAVKRRQAEEALRESEEKYRLIAENTADLISILDMNLQFTYVSPASMRLRGFTVEEAMKQTLEQVLTPESMRLALTVFEKEMQLDASGTADPGRTRILELEEYKKDGSIIWMEVNLSFLRDKDRKPVEILIVSRDITERKRAEEELRESEEKYRNILENIEDGYFEVDLAGNFTFFNPFLCRILGYPREEMPGMNNRTFMDAENAKKVFRTFNEVYVTGIPQKGFEWETIRKDGARTYIEVSVSLIARPGEKPTGFRGIARDVTERKRAEESLRLSEENFRRSMDESPLGIGIVSEEGEILYVNRTILDFFGYETIEELRETPFTKRYMEPGYAEFLGRREKRRLHADDSFDYEIDIVRKDGEVRHLQVWRKRVLWNGKKHYQVIYRDITDRKRAEEKIQASLREKETLLLEIHHRVKNNMQVISGLLALQARSSGNPELIERLNESQSRIRSMALIHEKLYGSKDFARIALVGYVRALSQELFQLYKINPGKIDLIVQPDGDVYVDINKAIPCGLILNELISNALRHAFPGDGPGELRIIIHETKNTEIEIVVRDNGFGLPDDVDIHQPRTVGLHLVNGLVKNQLDGQIEVRRDNGTEFRIKFPL